LRGYTAGAVPQAGLNLPRVANARDALRYAARR